MEFDAYSRDDNWIDLRWKPPYPPTGTLENYKIECIPTFTNRKNPFDIDAEPCSFWNEYLCFRLKNLKAYSNYIVKVRNDFLLPNEKGAFDAFVFLQIWAKNKDVEEYSIEREIHTRTAQGSK